MNIKQMQEEFEKLLAEGSAQNKGRADALRRIVGILGPLLDAMKDELRELDKLGY